MTIARLALAVVLGLRLFAAEPAKAPLVLRAPVQDKNFYLLSMIERTPEVRAAVASDPVLAAQAVSQRTALHSAFSCGMQVTCYTSALRWNTTHIQAAGGALAELYDANPAMKRMVDGPLRSSGLFQRYDELGGRELVKQAFEDAARGLDKVIEIYGAGQTPRYPEIDSISFQVASAGYPNLLRTMVGVLDEDSAAMDLFFQPSLRFALALLEANHRDEPARFEPLESGENAKALQDIGTVAWDQYPYSVILVPGSGPDRPTWSLSAMGKLRLQLAVRRYRAGKAPFLLVSGGCAHPAQTPYAEAIEMKRSLMDDFHVPADAILVEPFARHTTTNLRNGARLIYRYGIPFDKKVLITTDQEQSAAIESTRFADRCMRELGYLTGKIGARISDFDLEFLPAVVSLHADAIDPLDP